MRRIREIARSYREDRRIRRAKLPWRELESEAARQGCSPADIFFDRAGRSISDLHMADAKPGRRDIHPEDTDNDPRSAMSVETNHRKETMTEKHDHPARPEQPGKGGFGEGQETLPDDERVGQFSDGNEELPDDERVGQFSDGNEELPEDEREGRFSDNVEADDH